MDWTTFIITLMGGSLVSLITTVGYFRPKLKLAQAEAKKAGVDAEKEAQSFYETRIKHLEEFSLKQGEALDAVRKQLLDLSIAKQKSDERIVELETENRALKKELNTIKTQMKRHTSFNKPASKNKSREKKPVEQPIIVNEIIEK